LATTQVDLFLDSLVDAPLKDDRALMEFPFFSLQKQPRTEPIVYDDGNVKITVEAGARGIATIWDKDIMIYAASVINDRLERGAPVNRTIQFPAHDFMKVTGRGTGKRAYELFLDAMQRLKSTTITTSIEAGGDRERRGFGWVDDWRVIERTTSTGTKVMAGVEVTLNRWMFNAIVKDRRVLTINRDYFGLTKGLERRLYELARKHCGSQPEWFIGLEKLAEKCGTVCTMSKFKQMMTAVVADASIPDYRVELVTPAEARTPFKTKGDQPMVRFSPLVQERTIRPVMAQRPKAAPPAPILDQGEIYIDARTPTALVVSIHGYEQARRDYPGYDIEYLERRWREWTQAQGATIKQADKAFLAWCRTYTANNPI
jgi:plasmid replication initiation protein